MALYSANSVTRRFPTSIIGLMKAVLIHISYCLLYPTRSVHRSYRRCKCRLISIHIQDRLLCVREEYFPSMSEKFVSLTYCPAWIAIYKFVCAGLLVSWERTHNVSRRVFDCIIMFHNSSQFTDSSNFIRICWICQFALEPIDFWYFTWAIASSLVS